MKFDIWTTFIIETASAISSMLRGEGELRNGFARADKRSLFPSCCSISASEQSRPKKWSFHALPEIMIRYSCESHGEMLGAMAVAPVRLGHIP